MLLSQVALNAKLKNFFSFYSFKRGGLDSIRLDEDFESGQVIVIDDLSVANLDFFKELKTVIFPDWVPPVFSSKILKTPNEVNELWKFYPCREHIEVFQEKMKPFEESLTKTIKKLFPVYSFNELMFSWRMNELNLGNLHFDIPESDFPEQQIRFFVNLSERPRIIEFGPTFEEIVKSFYLSDHLSQYSELSYDKFVEVVKFEIIKKKNS